VAARAGCWAKPAATRPATANLTNHDDERAASRRDVFFTSRVFFVFGITG